MTYCRAVTRPAFLFKPKRRRKEHDEQKRSPGAARTAGLNPKAVCQQSDHRQMKYAVMVRAKPLQVFPRHMEVQRECQSLRQAMAIEEMAEGVELVSECEEQAIQNGRP